MVLSMPWCSMYTLVLSVVLRGFTSYTPARRPCRDVDVVPTVHGKADVYFEISHVAVRRGGK